MKASDFESLAHVTSCLFQNTVKKTDPNIWSDLQMHLYLSIIRDKSSDALRVEYVGPL